MNETVTLTFTKEQLKVINDGVILLPYWRAQPVISEINNQIEVMLKAEGIEQ